MSNERDVFKGGSNIFADIGLPDADEHLVEANLVRKIIVVMRERRLTQTRTAELLGVGQPEFSDMIRGRFEQVSVDKLLRHLVALGLDVEIIARPLPHETTRSPELRTT